MRRAKRNPTDRAGRSALLLYGLALLSAGCGRAPGGVAPVSGRVTLDEKPVAQAAVMFIPLAGGRPAQGVTDADGNYRLTTIKPGDGAQLGEHRVTVTKVEAAAVAADDHGLSGLPKPDLSKPGLPKSGGLQSRWIVPQRFSDPEHSSLTARVEAGENRKDWLLRTAP